MKYWSQSEKIINATLNLLNDLSVGYSSVRKLVKLEAIQFVMNNHTVSERPIFFSSGFLCKIIENNFAYQVLYFIDNAVYSDWLKEWYDTCCFICFVRAGLTGSWNFYHPDRSSCPCRFLIWMKKEYWDTSCTHLHRTKFHWNSKFINMMK